MRRHKIHKGMRVFLNTLKATESRMGISSEMKDMIGTFIIVKGYSRHYSESIHVRHPHSHEKYTIDCKDVSLEPKLTGRTETFKMEKEIKARFDVNTLYV